MLIGGNPRAAAAAAASGVRKASIFGNGVLVNIPVTLTALITLPRPRMAGKSS